VGPAGGLADLLSVAGPRQFLVEVRRLHTD
jgi:hypothetical protein